MRRLLMGVLALGVVSFVPRASAESVEDVAKKITAAAEKIKSFSARTKMVTEVKQEGFSMTTTAEGTTEVLHKGDDFLSRAEMKQVMEMNAGGNVNKQETTTLSITDGAFSYTLSETGGMKTAQKMKMQKADKEDPFKAWRDTANLKVLPEASVDGRAVWVIEATSKGGDGTMILSFDKETGQMIKMVANGPDGKPMTTMTYSDIKVNADIPADRFVFKAPAGVEVQDLSNG